jgi:hypothetical protein
MKGGPVIGTEVTATAVKLLKNVSFGLSDDAALNR